MAYWSTQKQINIKLGILLRKINLTRKKLARTLKNKLVENFGQNYVRKFQDELNSIDATFSNKQRIQHEIDEFNEWVSNFTGIN